MKEQDYSSRITDEWLIGDVLQQYPSTFIISLQQGPASRTQRAGHFRMIPGSICKNMLS